MISDFGSWYRAVQIEPNDERLQKRWTGIENAAKACDLESALELARLFSGFPVHKEGWLTDFKNHFQEEDSAFDPDSTTAELVVLAGTTIVQVLATKGKAANAAAMAAQVAAFGLAPERRRIPAIRKSINAYLIEQATAARAAPTRRASANRSKKIEAVVTALQTGHQQAADPIKAILTDLGAQIDDNDERLVKAERIRAESSGVLWWLMGAYSETAHAAFSEVSSVALPVICGFEIAQLTQMIPALPNARAFLLQAMGNRPPKTQTIVDWIRAVERPVRQGILESAECNATPLLPLVDGMRKSLSLANDDLWASDVGLRGASNECSAIECAEQLQRELLLCRHLKSGA